MSGNNFHEGEPAMSTRYSAHADDGPEPTELEPYSDSAAQQYEDLFVQWSDRWERVIRLTAMVFIALLLVTQVLLQWPLFRHAAVRVERLEGEPYQQSGQP